MTERYPDDGELLNLQTDPVTGVDYIPTGQSPYVLAFRRLVDRLLRVAERANDLRPYVSGDLAVGVRPGRCRIDGQSLEFGGVDDLAVPAGATTTLWLDAAGTLQQSTAGLPADRSVLIPIAVVTTDTVQITAMTDLRGESFLHARSLGELGLTATAAEINQVLDGVGPRVTAATLTGLCNDGTQDADTLHRHSWFTHAVNGTAALTLVNDNWEADANIALRLMLPWLLSGYTELRLNRDNGFFTQDNDTDSFNLVGTVHAVLRHAGPLAASEAGVLIGPAPISGQVLAVILSARLNTVSTSGSDGVAVSVAANGQAVTATPARLTAAAGSGFRCTDQGDGDAATLVGTAAGHVQRGDLLTADLAVTAGGTVSQPPTDLAVLVVIRADAPA